MDTNEKKELFKTTFKGFDKKGVTEYIRMLSAKSIEEVASKTAALESCKQKAAETEKKLAKSNADLAVAATEIVRLKRELEDSVHKAEILEEENRNLTEKLAETDKHPLTDIDSAHLEDEVARLEQELSEQKLETERRKLEIADVLIKAEHMSKILRDEAIAAANEQKAAIERQIISKKSELLSLTGEIERMKNIFSDLYKRYVKE